MNGKNRGLGADEAAKRFLHRRSIVATIIGGLVEEFRDMPREEIETYLGDSEFLEGLENDSFLIPRRQDVTFEKVLPLPNGDIIHLMVNLEPQDDGSRMGHLWDRGRDHSADLRVRQGRGRRRIMKNLEGRFPGKHKVRMRTMSVWILMSPRADLRNSIHVFTREDHVIYGPKSPRLIMEDDDAIVFLCLGDPEEVNGEPMPGLLEALDWSMVRGIDDRKRAEKLSELGYEVDREMESELIGMNSIEADRERRARREGIAEGVSKGRAEGKIETASRMLADGMPEDKVRQYTGLTEEQIEEARRLLRGIP
jgi:hypothetical protein